MRLSESVTTRALVCGTDSGSVTNIVLFQGPSFLGFRLLVLDEKLRKISKSKLTNVGAFISFGNICVTLNWIISPSRGKHKKSLKPVSSFFTVLPPLSFPTMSCVASRNGPMLSHVGHPALGCAMDGMWLALTVKLLVEELFGLL